MFDFSELMKLAADLEKVPENSGKWLRKAVEVSARNVKDTAIEKVRSRTYFSGAARAIDYEVQAGGSNVRSLLGGGSNELTAEIGYNKDRPGSAFGHMAEFGAPRARAFKTVMRGGELVDVPVKGKPPRPLPPGGELQAALHENEGDFVAGIEAAIDDALKESGL
ncbi:hypothetical protein AB3K78_15475 [Leucobacter sp. HNU]|uniref:hypothetical protein n=1 Tax=Leucobacter sp. HNU TaxID=3236805 RepID=UPI003A7FFFC3